MDLLRHVTLPLIGVDVILDKDPVLLEGVKNIKERVYPPKGSALFCVIAWNFKYKLWSGFIKAFYVFNPKVLHLGREVTKVLPWPDATGV
jgi:hypothetical protein